MFGRDSTVLASATAAAFAAESGMYPWVSDSGDGDSVDTLEYEYGGHMEGGGYEEEPLPSSLQFLNDHRGGQPAPSLSLSSWSVHHRGGGGGSGGGGGGGGGGGSGGSGSGSGGSSGAGGGGGGGGSGGGGGGSGGGSGGGIGGSTGEGVFGRDVSASAHGRAGSHSGDAAALSGSMLGLGIAFNADAAIVGTSSSPLTADSADRLWSYTDDAIAERVGLMNLGLAPLDAGGGHSLAFAMPHSDGAHNEQLAFMATPVQVGGGHASLRVSRLRGGSVASTGPTAPAATSTATSAVVPVTHAGTALSSEGDAGAGLSADDATASDAGDSTSAHH